MTFERKISFFSDFAGFGKPEDLPDAEARNWRDNPEGEIAAKDKEEGYSKRMYPVRHMSDKTLAEAYALFDGLEGEECNSAFLRKLASLASRGTGKILISAEEGDYLVVASVEDKNTPFYKITDNGKSYAVDRAITQEVDFHVDMWTATSVEKQGTTEYLLEWERAVAIIVDTEHGPDIMIASRNGMDLLAEADVLKSEMENLGTKDLIAALAEKKRAGNLSEAKEEIILKHVPEEHWNRLLEIEPKSAPSL